MLDRFLKNLYMRISAECIPAKDIDFLIREDDFDKNTNVISVDVLQTHIDLIIQVLKEEQRQKEIKERNEMPIKKFMYIEDGSVDTDELIEELERTNPEIKVIVYRHGSQPPKLFDVQSNDN